MSTDIRIRLRDFETTVHIPKHIFMRFHSLDEIAEYICNELAEKWARSMLARRLPIGERRGKTRPVSKMELMRKWYHSHYYPILEILKRDLRGR
ncbi:MAG: hypothetical protein QXS37_06780 [Candidatus Aenigmatarchaeota archaeon]